MRKILFVTFFVLFSFVHTTNSQAQFTRGLIDQVKKSVVSIRAEVIESVYASTGVARATGFLIDKENGILVTNRHVANNTEVAVYYVSFFNGKRAKAHFIYSDPWHDFAFMQIDPNDIPDNVHALHLTNEKVQLNDEALIVGNNNGDEFSIQLGHVSNLYDSVGYFPTRSYGISLNTRGGSSGSPIVNEYGDVFALNAAGSSTLAYALPIPYVIDAYEKLIADQDIKRLHNGMLLSYIPIDYAVQYLDLPENVAEEYAAKHPDAKRKILLVDLTLPNSPAEKVLNPGDVILAVNGIEVGADMYRAERIMNSSENGKVKLRVLRLGEIQEIETELYDLHQKNLNRFVRFSDIIFYECDDLVRLIAGTDGTGVYATNFYSKSGFFPGRSTKESFYLIKIISMGGYKINNLDDLEKIIPELVEKEFFTVRYENYTPRKGYNSSVYVNRQETVTTADYNQYHNKPVMFEFDYEKKFWTKTEIE